VDRGLIDHHAAVERRVKLQLESNSGKIPDPIGDAIRKPIKTDMPNIKVKLAKVAQGFTAQVQPYADARVSQHGKDRRINVNLVVALGDESNAPMYLKSSLRKQGIKDEDDLDRICAEVIPCLELQTMTSSIGIPIKKNEGGHHLGLTKIAYEMAHHWLGDAWLEDPISVGMRKALRGDKTAGGLFTVGNGSSMPRPRLTRNKAAAFDGLDLGYDPTETNVLTLYRIERDWFVCIWLLDAFNAMYTVTRSAESYPKPDRDAIIMNVVKRQYLELESVMPVIPSP